ncbi:hypothetical protein EPH95_01610 [Salicibibacter halophilus]|uniref:Uncharacterized protein n=1 Tax=Salicibibacter halophilus TaxID=2502791 RepID=A0A514LDV5_9BACI|nr:hypothetical protein [Salicibibacter halophilus]QDI90029.1 hypothetical protein EPH95_01610 [Salicibibacter halophilus]
MSKAPKRYFYLRSLNHSIEPITWSKIKEDGFDLTIKREDVPFFISFFRELTGLYENKATRVSESHRIYMEELAAFFREQAREMSQCTSLQSETNVYVIPFSDFVAAFMLADEAFERIFQDNEKMAHHFDKVLTYYKRFNLKADPMKAQFILDHLPELSFHYE